MTGVGEGLAAFVVVLLTDTLDAAANSRDVKASDDEIMVIDICAVAGGVTSIVGVPCKDPERR